MSIQKLFSSLLPFQATAVDEVVEGLSSYEGAHNTYQKSQKNPKELWGKPKPYLHRIKAVTGAGKTPMLAAVAGRLKDCLIIWTTPRRAVISQTTESLCGKYNNLLSYDGAETTVITLDEALSSNEEWDRVINAEKGKTIITTTVGSFNREDATLKIHQGSPTPWEQLAASKRPLYVFYDEGHNATEAQFDRLEELRPKALIMASASPLSKSLYRWIPGEDDKDKEAEVNENRTTKISTSEVVANGLLKKTIKIFDLETSSYDLLKEAVDKWTSLDLLTDQKAIACYVVDRTEDGLGVWENLVKLSVPPETIAVHLTGARAAAKIAASKGKLVFEKLRATYDDELDPSSLRKAGYKHIIWNLSLEEGWDEPWAYIGYFHGEQRDTKRVVQRIGRLIRNPYKNELGQPFCPDDEELRTVSCFLRTENKLLKQIVDGLKSEMDTQGLDVIETDKRDDKAKSENEPCIKPGTIPDLCISVKDAFLSEIRCRVFTTSFIESDRIGKGTKIIGSYEVGAEWTTSAPVVMPLGVPSTAAEIVKGYFELKDARLIRSVGSVGGWISPSFWTEENQEKVYIGSNAYTQYRQRCDAFIENRLDLLIDIILDPSSSFTIPPMKLINPDRGSNDKQKKYYKRHVFKNARHASYNGLNDFELEMAEALDKTNFVWCRNPSRTGYGIPLPRPSGTSTMFYPDFILWKDDLIFFVETKGSHLLEDAVKGKMIGLPAPFRLGLFTKKNGDDFLYRLANGKVIATSGASLAAELGKSPIDLLLADFIGL